MKLQKILEKKVERCASENTQSNIQKILRQVVNIITDKTVQLAILFTIFIDIIVCAFILHQEISMKMKKGKKRKVNLFLILSMKSKNKE